MRPKTTRAPVPGSRSESSRSIARSGALEHPQSDRFDTAGFRTELEAFDLDLIATEERWGSFAWFTARKQSAT